MPHVHDETCSCPAYKVVRHYFNRPGRVRTILDGVTLAQAREHCGRPDTSSSTETRRSATTRRNGPWFDGYAER